LRITAAKLPPDRKGQGQESDWIAAKLRNR
jgi:hypothetical protein